MIEDTAKFKEKFIALIKESENVIITSHPLPDEDSMGGVMVMRSLVSEYSNNANIRIVYTSEIGNRWSSLSGIKDVESGVDMDSALEEADAVIIIDANNYSRVGISADAWSGFSGKKICIDHHEKNESEFDLSYIDYSASSVTEILYDVFYKDRSVVSVDIADLLLMGILGDTGMLSFVSRDKSHVFNVVYRLVHDFGSDIISLRNKYFNHPISGLEVIRDGLSNVKVLDGDKFGKCLSLYISDDIYKRTGLSQAEVNHAKDYIITKYSGMFDKITWGFVVYPLIDGDPHVSFRSRNEDMNVRELIDVLGLFGGGHSWASGAEIRNPDIRTSEDAYNEIVKRLTDFGIVKL